MADPTATTKLGAIADWYCNHYWVLTADGWQTRCGLTPNVFVQGAVRYYPTKPICPEPDCRAFDTTLMCPTCGQLTRVVIIDEIYHYRCALCGYDVTPEGC